MPPTLLYGAIGKMSMNFWLLVVLILFEDGACQDAGYSGVRPVYEICQLETLRARCDSNSEVIVMTSARYGRMKVGRCVRASAEHSNDPMFLGCSEDVLPILDMKCSSKPTCDVMVPNEDLYRITPCYHDLSLYLEASYTCVKVVQESRRCVVSVTTEAQFISSSSSSTSSDVNSVSSCGSESHPWRLEAAAGQRINISLLDFTAMSMSADRPHDQVTCRQYGYVLENNRMVTVCGGGGRQRNIFLSTSNNLQIVQTPNSEHSFLIKVEAVGCPDMIPPENAWLRRSNDIIIIGCISSSQTWQLTCDGREWIGDVGICPEMWGTSVGCPDMPAPANGWLRRSDDTMIIGCFYSRQTWQLTCDGHAWIGDVGTCPETLVGCPDVRPPENGWLHWLRRSNDIIIIGCISSPQTWQLTCDGRDWIGDVGTCPETPESGMHDEAEDFERRRYGRMSV